MAKVKQLTVSLENQPGRLAAVAKALADAKVNIEAVLAATAGAQGSAQLIVDNVAKAKKALSTAQFAYTEGMLEQVELPNKVGALADFTAKLAKNGVNIDAAWSTVPKGARKSVLLLATSKQAGESRL
jgi:hypothetical protein